MKYGLSEAEFDVLIRSVVQPLKDLGAIVFLFGSRATNKHTRFSDIDLIYDTGSKAAIPGHVIYSILSSVEETNFPYKIDLVNRAEIAAGYKAQVEREMVRL